MLSLPPRPARFARLRAYKQAFTIIEALITSAIVATASFATLGMVSYSRLQNDLEQERSRAQQIVSQQMEQIRHQLFTHVASGTTTTIWDNSTPDNASDDTTGTLQIELTDVDGNALSAAPVPAKRVRVEVTLVWQPRGRLSGKTFRETLMTFIAP